MSPEHQQPGGQPPGNGGSRRPHARTEAPAPGSLRPHQRPKARGEALSPLPSLARDRTCACGSLAAGHLRGLRGAHDGAEGQAGVFREVPGGAESAGAGCGAPATGSGDPGVARGGAHQAGKGGLHETTTHPCRPAPHARRAARRRGAAGREGLPGRRDSEGSSPTRPLHRRRPAGLRELGYIEGKNIVIETGYVEGQTREASRVSPPTSFG